MILPIRTSVIPRRKPVANYILIAVNIAVFLLSTKFFRHPQTGELISGLRVWVEPFILVGTLKGMKIWQLLSYAFLHGGFWHIAANMYFLYLFGGVVNDRLGNLRYISFYLAGCVFSGLGHVLVSNSPVLGASGAVAAVTGAYLVLFPRTLITVMYWLLFIIDAVEIRAIWFIAAKMILLDNIINDSGEGVAYGAHLSGYAFGIGAIFLALLTGIIKPDQMNLMFVISQWRRRKRYRGTVSDGYSPFTGSASRTKKVASRAKTSVSTKSQAEPSDETSEKIMNIRAEIARFIGVNNLSDAAGLYLNILEIEPEHVLPRQHQLDMSNQLMSMGKWQESATAYEKFLTFYKSYEYIEQVELMLGILYSRYLSEPEKAIAHLKAAKERLTEASQIKMCQDELAKLANH